MVGRRAAAPPGELRAAAESDLLLREMSHRVGVEFAAIRAILELALRQPLSDAARGLISTANERAGFSSRKHDLLSRSLTGRMDVGTRLAAVCRTIGVPGSPRSAGAMWLDLPATPLPVRVARRVLLVACDLLRDSVEQALDGRRGRVSVRLRATASAVTLRVADDRRQGSWARSADCERVLCRELVEMAGGRMSSAIGPKGAVVIVRLPLDDEPAVATVDPPTRGVDHRRRDRLLVRSLSRRWSLDAAELADILAHPGVPDVLDRRFDPVTRERLVLASDLADALEHLFGADWPQDWLRTPMEAYGWRSPLVALGDDANLRALVGAAEALAIGVARFQERMAF